MDPVRVLHVDDDPDLTDLTAEYLIREDDSFDVTAVTSVDEALAVLENREVDCIVSDYDMPGHNGIEFLERVRADYPQVPFFLYTGKGSEEIASEAISAGVDDYLQKSHGTDHFSLLAKRISNAVEKHRSAKEAASTRRFFSTLVEYTTAVIPVIDPTGTLLYVSPSSKRILGYEPEDVIGDNAFDYIHPEDVERASSKFLETIENPESMPEVIYRFKHADGSWVELHGRAKNLIDDEDVGGIVSYNRIVD